MAVAFKDYYEVLGVKPEASPDEIKSAFRTLARKFHPDVARDKKVAEERFKDINEANEVLGKPQSRATYDELRADWKTGAAQARSAGPAARASGPFSTSEEESEFHFEGTGFSDFFSQFFSEEVRRGRHASSFGPEEFGHLRGRSRSESRGQDLHGDILITLEEVCTGALRTISVQGRRDRGGNGGVETLEVRVPKGVRANQLIRVSGHGAEGMNGGRRGDIYLRVRFAEHPDWQVKELDLEGYIDLSPWEAVLGATVTLRTLTGSIAVKVPAGLAQGQKLRIRGHGLPAKGGKTGDLYAEARLQVPPGSNEGEKRLWRELAALSTFDPRAAAAP